MSLWEGRDYKSLRAFNLQNVNCMFSSSSVPNFAKFSRISETQWTTMSSRSYETILCCKQVWCRTQRESGAVCHCEFCMSSESFIIHGSMSTKHASILTKNLYVWKDGNQVIQTQSHGGHNVFSLCQKNVNKWFLWVLTLTAQFVLEE
jgi:hypothetical protein